MEWLRRGCHRGSRSSGVLRRLEAQGQAPVGHMEWMGQQGTAIVQASGGEAATRTEADVRTTLRTTGGTWCLASDPHRTLAIAVDSAQEQGRFEVQSQHPPLWLTCKAPCSWYKAPTLTLCLCHPGHTDSTTGVPLWHVCSAQCGAWVAWLCGRWIVKWHEHEPQPPEVEDKLTEEEQEESSKQYSTVQ